MPLRERYNDTQFTYSIKVLWDRYAARGFVIAFLLMLILLLHKRAAGSLSWR